MPVVALTPIYKPTEILIDLTEQPFDSSFTTVVADDGGGPDYRKIFQQRRPYAAVLSYQPSRGKGHALKTGYRYIRENFGTDGVVVTMDSDSQHVVDSTQKIAKRVAAAPDALILGVRTFGPGTPVRSQLGNTVTRAVFILFIGLRVNDMQTGLRSFTARILPFLFGMSGSRYEYEMDVSLQCAHRNIRISEGPIQTIYRNGNKGSHFHTLYDPPRIYKNILQSVASSFLAFCIDYGLYSALAVGLAGLGMDIGVLIANITAWTMSVSVNFAINKRFVFGSTNSTLRVGIQYFLLATGILLGNTASLNFLANSLKISQLAAELVAELTSFILSWVGWRFWIFRRQSTYAYGRTEKSQD